MSYSYKTENLGLPIWGSNDKPTQDDLNFQNQIIEKVVEKIEQDIKDGKIDISNLIPYVYNSTLSNSGGRIDYNPDGSINIVGIENEKYFKNSTILFSNKGCLKSLSNVNHRITIYPFDFIDLTTTNNLAICYSKIKETE